MLKDISALSVYEKRVLYGAALVFFITAFFSLGFHRLDEQTAVLELSSNKFRQATYQITPPHEDPLNLGDPIRASLQPAMVYGLQSFFSLFAFENPFWIAFFLRLISAALSFFTFILLYVFYRDKFVYSVLQKWFLWLSFFTWFAVYNGVRFSSENWSGIFFALGFLFYFSKPQKISSSLRHFLSGILLGFSFLFRFQVGFLVLGFGLWMLFVEKQKFQYLILNALGITFIFLTAGVLLDRWFFSQWAFSAWNYYVWNIVNGGASTYGVSPWYWYITTFISRGIPPFSLVFLFAFFYYLTTNLRSPITWSIIPFLAIHFGVGHKELRFLFPLLYFLPFICVHTFDSLRKKYITNFIEKNYVKIFVKIFVFVYALALLTIMFRPAEFSILLYKKLYYRYPQDTMLYYVSSNPYFLVHFYQRRNLQLKQVISVEQALQEISLSVEQEKNSSLPSAKILFVNSHENSPLLSNYPLIYSSIPSWLKNFNFTNWIERAPNNFVYEIYAEK